MRRVLGRSADVPLAYAQRALAKRKQQRLVGNHIDQPRHALGAACQLLYGAGVKQRAVRTAVAGNLQPVRDVALQLIGLQPVHAVVTGNALRELAQVLARELGSSVIIYTRSY